MIMRVLEMFNFKARDDVKKSMVALPVLRQFCHIVGHGKSSWAVYLNEMFQKHTDMYSMDPDQSLRE